MENSLTYINFEKYSEFSYNIIKKLVLEGNNMWKLLKYSQADALTREDLSTEEKISLIYKGEADSSSFRVFRIPLTDDAFVDQVCKIHVFPWVLDPYQRTNGVQTFLIQIVCHNKIGTLSDGRSRCDVLIEEIGRILNGAEINGIGPLQFNAAGGRPDYLKQVTWNKSSYYGYEFAISTGIV